MKFWGTSGSFSPLSVLLFVYFIYLLFFGISGLFLYNIFILGLHLFLGALIYLIYFYFLK